MKYNFNLRLQERIGSMPIDWSISCANFDTAFLTESQLGSPWGISIPEIKGAVTFHYVVSGVVNVKVGNENVILKKNALILKLRPGNYQMSDDEFSTCAPLRDLPMKPISKRMETLKYGGDKTTTQLLCGVLVYNDLPTKSLINALPEYIVYDSIDAQSMQILNLIKEECKALLSGSEGVVKSLANAFFINLIREHTKRENCVFLSLPDSKNGKKIEQALNLIHSHPEKSWSLESIAKQVGMSRSGFANNFKQKLGISVMDYITEWRITLALTMLKTSEKSILTVAMEVGYQNESSFSRVFKRKIGASPRDFKNSFKSNRIFDTSDKITTS